MVHPRLCGILEGQAFLGLNALLLWRKNVCQRFNMGNAPANLALAGYQVDEDA